ncbi:MAG: hypothetical protein L0H38_03225 [bacterium]|nr:hypothetical protein [bacterium]
MVSKKSKQSTPAPDNKGSGPKLKTSEEHASAKAAAKRRQARNRNKAGAKQGTYYDETHGRNRHSNRNQEREVIRDFHQMVRDRKFDAQAAKAAGYVEIMDLEPDSFARVMAEAMIRAFPSAVPYSSGMTYLSKTDVAEEVAIAEMKSLDDTGVEGALRSGAHIARKALNWAWSQLH